MNNQFVFGDSVVTYPGHYVAEKNRLLISFSAADLAEESKWKENIQKNK